MNKEEERNYVFAQLSSLPNAFQYVSVTNYIENLEQENQKYKEVIYKAIEYIESKNNGHCIINGEEKGAFTFILNFDAGREFIWKLLDILKEVE